mmetsp:Transcript_28082/g.79367  ORF Transcript_28082/g.79367 Transcript_28082/m.79367 type:complete len:203 (+) Transcript_28082:1140-1748(+)
MEGALHPRLQPCILAVPCFDGEVAVWRVHALRSHDDAAGGELPKLAEGGREARGLARFDDTVLRLDVEGLGSGVRVVGPVQLHQSAAFVYVQPKHVHLLLARAVDLHLPLDVHVEVGGVDDVEGLGRHDPRGHVPKVQFVLLLPFQREPLGQPALAVQLQRRAHHADTQRDVPTRQGAHADVHNVLVHAQHVRGGGNGAAHL